MSEAVVLETKRLTKRFPGVVANEDVNLTVAPGEIRAIMGENGAGKSTLCNMLTGILSPTSGEIYFDGKRVSFSHPQEALRVGIRMVYQERNLIEYLTGAQSICLGQEDRKARFFVDERKIYKRAATICREIGADVPLDVPVERLSPAQQQMIEIIRAVAHEPKMLILDEPTASLGNAEVRILFDVMRKLQRSGVAILIITHKLDEVFEISDSISILRDGKLVGTVQNGSIDRMDVVRMMLGKDVSGQFPRIENTASTERILSLEKISDASKTIHNVSLSVQKGEVVGIYGLLGSGRTEILECIYGLREVISGTIKLGVEAQPGKKLPEEMVRKGVFLIPEDRRHLSVFQDFFNLKENLSIGYLHRISNRFGLIRARAERELFADIASREELRISYSRENQSIDELSGGNQQKVVLGRWVYRENMNLLLMDEPTQGIDVGVKYDIYVLIRKMAAQGKGILMVSSELPELTGVCDRLYILKDGEIKGELSRDKFDNEVILEMVL